jgi:hypothetical protein
LGAPPLPYWQQHPTKKTNEKMKIESKKGTENTIQKRKSKVVGG